jgi:hypothetical protein
MITLFIISSIVGIVFGLIDYHRKKKRIDKFIKQSDSTKNALRIVIKNLKFKGKMKNLDEYGGQLLEWYIKGFNDELKGSTTTETDDRLLMKAYNIGALDAIIGDDVQDYDMVAPNFSGIWKEATKMREEGEISELQLRKIFRILSGMRNQGEITLT